MRLNPWINIYVSVLLLGVEDLNPYTDESFFVNQVQLILLMVYYFTLNNMDYVSQQWFILGHK